MNRNYSYFHVNYLKDIGLKLEQQVKVNLSITI